MTLHTFVSSTELDLQPERNAVEAALGRLRETKFVGMEYFGSRAENTKQASLDEVDRSQVYIGIIGGRYGSGITADEYQRARQRNLPCFVYFKDETVIAAEGRETDAGKVALLAALKDEMRAAHTITSFRNPDELAATVTADLHRWLFDQYLSPRLEQGARGELPRTEIQSLLNAIRDKDSLPAELLKRLGDAGFVIASGDGSVAAGRDISGTVVTGNLASGSEIGGDFVAGTQVKVAGDQINIQAATPAATALHQLRAPVGDFVGREPEIETLIKALRSGSRACITGISGMGGIGKTELALFVAQRLKDEYADAQFFVNLQGTDPNPRRPEEVLAIFIRAFLGPEIRLPDDLDQLTQIYLSQLDGKRVLIVLDNAANSVQVRPLLPPTGCALLVTSRVTVTLPGMTPVAVPPLPAPKARELLVEIAKRAEPVADQICYLCGYLPLAIRAAGSLLAITADLDPADYMEQLKDERRRLELIGAEGVEIGVEASFKLSYERLEPEAARVFRQLAIFPATLDSTAEEVVCEDPGHAHLSDLVRRSLVLYDATTKRYRLHDLARLFADARLVEDDNVAAWERFASHYKDVLAVSNSLYVKGGEATTSALLLFDLEWGNIHAGHGWAAANAQSRSSALGLSDAYAVTGYAILDLRQHPRQQIVWIETALEAARKLNRRRPEGMHLANLGATYAALGECRRAIELYEQALPVIREVGDRLGEGKALGGLGVTYSKLNEASTAIEFYEQALVIFREIGDRRSEGATLGNLGITHDRQGDTRQAMHFYEQSLDIARQFGDRVSEANSLGNLASSYDDLGENARALEFYDKALLIAREIGDRRGEGTSLWNMSLLLKKLGERLRAISYAEEALYVFEQIEEPNVAMIRDRLIRWREQAD